jgi:hypothetical protein
MSINERFRNILINKHLKPKEAALILDREEKYVRKLMIEGSSFGLEPVKMTLNSFKDINPDWLIFGNGDMLRADNFTDNEKNKENTSSQIHLLGLLVEEKDKRIADLEERVADLKDRLNKQEAKEKSARTDLASAVGAK